MALASLLAEHSRDLTASINHQNFVEQDNVDRKANDLEEKFQHAKDAIEGAGGEITALAGAYHMGRKIYKKVQEKRAQLKQKADNPTQGDGETRATDASTNSSAPDPEGGESGGTQSSTGQQAEQERVAEDGQPDSQPTQPDREGPSQESAGAGEEIEDPDTTIGGRGAYQIEDVREGGVEGPLQRGPTGDLGRNVATGDIADAEPDVIAKTSKDTNILKEIGDEDVPEEGLSEGVTDGLHETLTQGIKSVGSKIASRFGGQLGGDALGAGLETASTILDALGPIGEVAGVITGLVGLFEGLHHKKKEIGETGQEATSTAAVTAGIDPSALTEGSSPSVGAQV